MGVHLTGPSLDFFTEMVSSFLLFFSIRVAAPRNVLEVVVTASVLHARASLPKISSSVIVSVSVLHFFDRSKRPEKWRWDLTNCVFDYCW